ncbi:MAG: Tex family protein [Spirochaetota bacterium]
MGDEGRIIDRVAGDLSQDRHRTAAVAELLADGATVPFIARYRKEHTGGMDEVAIRGVAERIEQYRALEARRESVLRSLEERGLLSDELRDAVVSAGTSGELEDIYLPFRPKRVTRASKARDRGLEPLARAVLNDREANPATAARDYLDPEIGVERVDDALAGARDIIAEWVSEDRESRAAVRELFEGASIITSSRSRRAKRSAEAQTYRDYFSWAERADRAKPHRVLAMLRGEREGHLVVHVAPPERDALDLLRRRWVDGHRPRAQQLELAVEDAYARLVAPSLEGERKKELFHAASEAAARVFSDNLRDLLLAPPLGPKRIIAIDPGLRTGCKIVCLDERGALLHNETVFPLEPHRREREAAERVLDLVSAYDAEAIAVGNGTGGRETVGFLRAIGRLELPVISVNESGASVYSASEVARAELPDHDVTVRGAVSIGRRLIDPLSELVKIEPRAIGVGQYQHDVDPRLLERRLNETVESCVNAVGAELNTASPHLLRHIAGVGERQAEAIAAYRAEVGGFSSRAQLLKVPGVGEKTYEQAAGFLRIRDGDEPLDATAVHPERYGIVRRMAADAGVSVADLVGDASLVERIPLETYVEPTVGIATLKDIIRELERPGRDPRPPFETTSFSEHVHSMDDLSPGMKLPGVVTNVTDFGAFVDIGVHRDGLVHISRLAKEFVRDPRSVVRVGQGVQVTVVEVDAERKRISLSMADLNVESDDSLENLDARERGASGEASLDAES